MTPHIVTIGGGNGQSELLRGLRSYNIDLTAIVTVMDSGGSTGVLREERGILAVGDARRCLAALTGPELEKEWNARDGDGHAAGNLVIADALADAASMTDALTLLGTEHDAQGRVLPVTEDSVQLCAALESGDDLIGEGVIDSPDTSITADLQYMYLKPEAHTTDQVVDAIGSADCIVLSMGDLYTSVVPNLLVEGVVTALQQKKPDVPLVYVCNRTTKKGETDGYTMWEYVRRLNVYLGEASVDTVLFDSSEAPVPSGYERVEKGDLPVDGVTVVEGYFADEAAPQFIAGKNVAEVIVPLCTS